MQSRDDFVLVGVLHLPPLPGAPRGGGGRQPVIDRALADAEALVRGGVGACIIENIGDAPFTAGPVSPQVPALMAVVADRVASAFGPDLAMGINVLRNDACAALGVAVAAGGRFIRVNVLTGAAWTDQGLIEGAAHDVLRLRRELDAVPAAPLAAGGVSIVADVFVKHAVPLGWTDVARAARDTALRGGADVLVVTGDATGTTTDLGQLDRVCDAVDGTAVWVGSGVTPADAPEVRRRAQGAIVGTWLHQDGRIDLPLDVDRVRRLVDAIG